ncbi:hypothetical protein GCM10025298_06410 [Natronobiforma cellulositropha]
MDVNSDRDNGGNQPEEKQFPEQPETLDTDDVREFVAAYEETHIYNHNKSPSSVIEVDCVEEQSVVNYTTEKEKYVSIIDCEFNEFRREGGNGTGTGATPPALYAVTRERSVRIEPRIERYSDPYITDEQTSRDATGIWLSNFSRQSHTVSVKVVHRTDGDSHILEEKYEMASESGLHMIDMIGMPGAYEIHAELETGESDEGIFNHANEQYSILPFAAITITSGGQLIVDTLEFAAEADDRSPVVK